MKNTIFLELWGLGYLMVNDSVRVLKTECKEYFMLQSNKYGDHYKFDLKKENEGNYQDSLIRGTKEFIHLGMNIRGSSNKRS